MPLTQAQLDTLKQQAAALTGTINSLVADSPPPSTGKADVISIDLAGGQAAVLLSKMLDGSPGWDGNGGAIHYGDMAGGLTYSNGVPDYSEKFSNPSVKPLFLVDNAGRHYLEAASDQRYPFAPGVTANRLIDWKFHYLPNYAELWAMAWLNVDSITGKNQNNLGIKLFGFGGGVPGYTFAEILELGVWNGSLWPLQKYSYDAEGDQKTEVFPGVMFAPDQWNRLDLHVRLNTMVNGVWAANGAFEVRLNGVPVWGRTDVLMYSAQRQGNGFTSFNQLFYDGGVAPPQNVVPNDVSLRARFGRFGVGKSGWIG